ncbi:MAG: ABC transporter permease [Candidatus Ranarchaeia archaeon]
MVPGLNIINVTITAQTLSAYEYGQRPIRANLLYLDDVASSARGSIQVIVSPKNLLIGFIFPIAIGFVVLTLIWLRYRRRLSPRRIGSMITKEISAIRKDVTAMVLLIVFPGLIIGTLYLAINAPSADVGPPQGESDTPSDSSTDPAFSIGSDRWIRIGVIDLDISDAWPDEDLSKNFTATLDDLEKTIVYIYRNETEALDDLFWGFIDGFIIIPNGFEGNLSSNIPAFIHVHSPAGTLLGRYFGAASQKVLIASTEFRIEHGWLRSDIFTDTVIEFDAEGDPNALDFGAFILAFVILFIISMIASQSIVGDVPLRRMLLTPAGKFEVILAKLLAHFIIGVLEGEALLVIWMVVFEVVPNAGFETLSIIMCLLALVGSALGVAISSLASTRLQANQMFLMVLFASFILSGIIFDVGVISEWMPMNLGVDMLGESIFRGTPILYQLDPTFKILTESAGLTLFATLILWRRRSYS